MSIKPGNVLIVSNIAVTPVHIAWTFHMPHDLSRLCLSALNPWGSLCCHCCFGHYPHLPCQFAFQRQHPLVYPTNSYMGPTLKPPSPAPTHIVKTIWHPYGIGLNKPAIQVPIRRAVKIHSHPTPPSLEEAQPSQLTHPIVTVQCSHRQLVHVPPVSSSPTLQSCCTVPTLISDILSHSFSSPSQLFSHFRFP